MRAHSPAVKKKERGRPFQKGNPGRPVGAKNRSTALQGRLEEFGEKIVDKLIEKALEGDSTALRVLAPYLLVPKTEPSISDLEIPKIQTPANLPDALSAVIQAVATEKITPGQGAILMDMLERNARAFGGRDEEARLASLEAKMERFKAL
jgi:hypothetical protein